MMDEHERQRCAFCGTSHAHHRVVDAILDRINAGEPPRDVILDHDMNEDQFQAMVARVLLWEAKEGQPTPAYVRLIAEALDAETDPGVQVAWKGAMQAAAAALRVFADRIEEGANR